MLLVNVGFKLKIKIAFSKLIGCFKWFFPILTSKIAECHKYKVNNKKRTLIFSDIKRKRYLFLINHTIF